MYMCVCVREVRGVGGWIPTILFVLCPTLPASLFIALLCSFHTELMRETHTLNTLLLAGTGAHSHTYALAPKPTTVTFQMQMRELVGLMWEPGEYNLSTCGTKNLNMAASLHRQNVNIFCSLSLLLRQSSWQQVHVSAHWLNTHRDAQSPVHSVLIIRFVEGYKFPRNSFCG